MAAEELYRVPILKSLMNGNNMVLVNRGGTQESRDAIIEKLSERQRCNDTTGE